MKEEGEEEEEEGVWEGQNKERKSRGEESRGKRGGGGGGGRGGGGRLGKGTTFMIFFPAGESRPYWYPFSIKRQENSFLIFFEGDRSEMKSSYWQGSISGHTK